MDKFEHSPRWDREQQRAYIVWSALERAADHLSPGHPAELHIRRALAEAEAYWQTLRAQRDRLPDDAPTGRGTARRREGA